MHLAQSSHLTQPVRALAQCSGLVLLHQVLVLALNLENLHSQVVVMSHSPVMVRVPHSLAMAKGHHSRVVVMGRSLLVVTCLHSLVVVKLHRSQGVAKGHSQEMLKAPRSQLAVTCLHNLAVQSRLRNQQVVKAPHSQCSVLEVKLRRV